MNKIVHWFELIWWRIADWYAAAPRSKPEKEKFAVWQRFEAERYESFMAQQKEIIEQTKFLKNINATIMKFIANGQYAELSAYMDEVSARLDSDEAADYEPTIVTETVKFYANKAEAIGTRVEADLNAGWNDISDRDLHSLLTDVLRNALEAQDDVKISNRYITLKLERQKPYFIITCENSKTGAIIEVNGRFRSTKSGLGRGLGILSIEHIAERYSGSVTIKHDSTHFIITVMLRDKQAINSCAG
jgi:sensor histidine kinase regulating citrate/malate metabolism